MYRNGEGYYDPTAGRALSNLEKKDKHKKTHSKKDSIATLSQMIRQIASLTGFRVVGTIVLEDRTTGRRFEI